MMGRRRMEDDGEEDERVKYSKGGTSISISTMTSP